MSQKLYRLNFHKQMLFDGLDDQLFDNRFNVEIGDTKVTFILDEITPNKFDKLSSKQEIIDRSSFISNNIYKTYESEERLDLYYYETDSYLFIFSFGEFQPARYKLYLESVWKKQ